jgi:hypothetical protein
MCKCHFSILFFMSHFQRRQFEIECAELATLLQKPGWTKADEKDLRYQQIELPLGPRYSYPEQKRKSWGIPLVE